MIPTLVYPSELTSCESAFAWGMSVGGARNKKSFGTAAVTPVDEGLIATMWFVLMKSRTAVASPVDSGPTTTFTPAAASRWNDALAPSAVPCVSSGIPWNRIGDPAAASWAFI